MKLIKNVLIGGDIEVFLQDKETKEIVSAEGIIQGTKYEPFNFDKEDEFACTSLDNVLAEFNLKPAKTKAEYYFAIEKALNYIKSIIPANLEPVALPAARLDSKYLKTENAMLLGCSVDYNAWTNEPNERPDGEMTNLRSGGLHISVGYDNPDEQTNLDIVKSIDLHISVPSVLQEPSNERKQLYGKAGAFRHTHFGVEARSTSNYLLQDKKLVEWGFDNTMKAIDFINNGNKNILDEEADIIISCVNDKDEDKAKYLIKKYKIKLAA